MEEINVDPDIIIQTLEEILRKVNKILIEQHAPKFSTSSLY
ncbi:MAG: hypothetical protein ACI83O_000381 [Patescibacteria group bacterium]|jgi:hypothetical protein